MLYFLPCLTLILIQVEISLVTSSAFPLSSAFSEQCGEKWELTKVVKKEELGKPAERLKETTAKLQMLALCNGKVNNSETRSRGMLEQMLAVAEERVRGQERNETGNRGSRELSIIIAIKIICVRVCIQKWTVQGVELHW